MNPISVPSNIQIELISQKFQNAAKQEHNSLSWDHWAAWESQSEVAEDQE